MNLQLLVQHIWHTYDATHFALEHILRWICSFWCNTFGTHMMQHTWHTYDATHFALEHVPRWYCSFWCNTHGTRTMQHIWHTYDATHLALEQFFYSICSLMQRIWHTYDATHFALEHILRWICSFWCNTHGTRMMQHTWPRIWCNRLGTRTCSMLNLQFLMQHTWHTYDAMHFALEHFPR